METVDIIAQAIEQLLPSEHKEKALSIAQLIFKSNDKSQEKGTTTTGGTELELVNMLKSLDGKTVKTKEAIIEFGKESQMGDISIRDIVGGNTITLNITFQASAENRSSFTVEDFPQSILEQKKEDVIANFPQIIQKINEIVYEFKLYTKKVDNWHYGNFGILYPRIFRRQETARAITIINKLIHDFNLYYTNIKVFTPTEIDDEIQIILSITSNIQNNNNRHTQESHELLLAALSREVIDKRVEWLTKKMRSYTAEST